MQKAVLPLTKRDLMEATGEWVVSSSSYAVPALRTSFRYLLFKRLFQFTHQLRIILGEVFRFLR